MKFLFSFIFLLIAFPCLSQTFNANELIALYRDNYSEFDTKVLKKGFEYIKSVHRDNEEQISKYALNETEDDGFYTEVLKKVKFKSGIAVLSYQIDKKSDYLKIKDDLKTLRYKLYKSKSMGDNTVFLYKSPQQNYKDVFIQIAVGIVDNSKGTKQAVYEIVFHNNSDL